MIRQREDTGWEAYCDTPGCKQFIVYFEELDNLRACMKENCWEFSDPLKPCYCGKHKGRKENPKQMCVAREGKFYTAASFREAIFKCPLADKDTGCPARKYALWEYQYTHWITTRDVYKIHRTPEFLTACSQCLGEGEVVDAEITVNDRVDALEKRIKVMEENWKKLSESFMFLAIMERLPKEEKK